MKAHFGVLMGMVLFLTLSCKEKLIEAPEDLIPQNQMEDILYDLALINGLRTTNGPILDDYNIETMPYLYKKYGIDSLQFVESDEYYASVPIIYQSMYSSVKERLEQKIKEQDELREQKTDSSRKRNQRIRDSLQKNASKSKLPKSVPLNK